MTLPLPDSVVDEGPWELERSGVQRNFEALAQAMAGFGGLSVEVRFGTGSITFTASAVSATTAITHGLGRAPVLTMAQVNTASQGFALYTSGKTTTQFSVAGWTTAAATTTVSFDWFAIG